MVLGGLLRNVRVKWETLQDALGLGFCVQSNLQFDDLPIIEKIKHFSYKRLSFEGKNEKKNATSVSGRFI